MMWHTESDVRSERRHSYKWPHAYVAVCCSVLQRVAVCCSAVVTWLEWRHSYIRYGCVSIRRCICIYIYTYIHTWLIHIRSFIWMTSFRCHVTHRIWISHVSIYVYIYIHIHIRILTHPYTHPYTHPHTLCHPMSISNLHTHTHTHTHTHWSRARWRVGP